MSGKIQMSVLNFEDVVIAASNISICSLFPQTTEILVAKNYLEESPITTQ